MDRRPAVVNAPPQAVTQRPAACAAGTLLVVGVHREEFDFGREVAAGLDAGEVDVLQIPQGLSGRRPLPDEVFRHRALHQELYRQLLPHMRGTHGLLIDLHTGHDEDGPCADLITADAALRARLQAALAQPGCGADPDKVRLIELGSAHSGAAHTVIPEQVWNSAAFSYVGIELYLPDDPAQRAPAVALARRLVRLVTGCSAPRG